jgi:hypothetical protein
MSPGLFFCGVSPLAARIKRRIADKSVCRYTDFMENPNNLNTGDQEFKHVGKMDAEVTASKNMPKAYDLYQDVESGALVGELPKNHPNENLYFENKIKNLDINLNNLSEDELKKILTQDNLKICLIQGHDTIEAEIWHYNVAHGGDVYCLSRKGTKDIDFSFINSPRFFEVRAIDKNKLQLFSIDDSKGRKSKVVSISFYEIPKGYEELVEQKKALDVVLP